MVIPDDFNPSNLTVFRSLYPEGRNFVLSHNVRTPYRRRYGGLQVNFISIRGLYQLK